MDEIFMRRCIELAKCGFGTASPNPMVGAVIVCDGKIIGEGWHRKCGEAHAEVNAVNSVADKSLLKKSAIYVSLEPCAHVGRTPACADMLIREGIPNIVVGSIDPFEKVAGKGIEKLRNAGRNVKIGVLREECDWLNRRFFTFHTKHRPYVILKWAQTADGFLDGTGEKPLRISSDITKCLVHKMRAEEMAILVGTRTALKDNPQLHTRRWYGLHPVRLVFDRNLSVPPTAHLYESDQPTVFFNAVKAERPRFVRLDFDADTLPAVMQTLYECGLQSLIVEGGAETLSRFLQAGLYDALQVEVGPEKCGQGTPAPSLPPHLCWQVSEYQGHRMYHCQKTPQ